MEDKQVSDDKVDTKNNDNGKDKGPLMILTSGKVVGNVAEQWKKVRDNRVKKPGQQEDVQGKSGKRIVPDDDVTNKNVQTAIHL